MTVVGAGSAGLLAALAVKKVNPHITVRVVFDSDIPVIGVGESTQPNLPNFLHNFLEIPYGEFYRKVKPTWKLGLRFKWGKRPAFSYPFQEQFSLRPSPDLREPGFYCFDDMSCTNELTAALEMDRSPVFQEVDGRLGMRLDHAYHIENRKFVDFLLQKAEEFGCDFLDAAVVRGIRGEDGYLSGVELGNGETLKSDLWIDSSGFNSVLLGAEMGVVYREYSDRLFCDRSVVGSVEYRSDKDVLRPYTCVDTFDCGWCFTIDHEDVSNLGYVFASACIADEDAVTEFRAAHPKVKDVRLIRFRSGRYEELWHRNVVGIGNASGFIEPLEATALAIACRASVDLAYALSISPHVPRKVVQRYNLDVGNAWDVTADFITFHYAFNDNRDTGFWRECRNALPAKIGIYEEYLEYYRACGPTSVMARHQYKEGDLFKLDGFLSLALGMRVPFDASLEISVAEKRMWEKRRRSYRERGLRALPQRQALEVVKSSVWRWPAPALSPYYQQGG
ncbi:MAG: tryptophan 7-halogenase [Alphaproteobacteria bacterium]